MKERFEGEEGKRLLVDAMVRQKALIDARDLVEEFIKVGTVEEVKVGKNLVVEGDHGTDLYFILAGAFEIRLKGNPAGSRVSGDLVGDFVASQPTILRSATLTALEANAVLKVSLADFKRLTDAHVGFWKAMNTESNNRLMARNASFSPCNDIPRILIFSSSEARTVMGELVINLGTGDDMIVETWDQIFAVSSYALPDLLEALDRSDFAIAIASADDKVTSRKKTKTAPRDNINFEFGMAIGRLGLDRAFLLAETGTNLKLPSDTYGLTYLPYKTGAAQASTLGAACEKIRRRVQKDGVRTN